MDSKRAPTGSALIVAAVAVILHGLLGPVLFAYMLFVIAAYKREFAASSIKLPWYTEVVVALSDWLISYWYVAVLSFIPFLALDGAVVYLCWRRRGTRVLAILWIVFVIVLWLLVVAFVALGIWLAESKLQQGLAR